VKDLTDPSYEPGTWVSLKNARDHFSEELGGNEGFDKWVIGSTMINPSEAYGTHNTVEKV
jgi:adenosine deaminase CECR1